MATPNPYEITDLSAWLVAHKDPDRTDSEGNLYVPFVTVQFHDIPAYERESITHAVDTALAEIIEEGEIAAHIVHDMDILPAGAICFGIGWGEAVESDEDERDDDE